MRLHKMSDRDAKDEMIYSLIHSLIGWLTEAEDGKKAAPTTSQLLQGMHAITLLMDKCHCPVCNEARKVMHERKITHKLMLAVGPTLFANVVDEAMRRRGAPLAEAVTMAEKVRKALAEAGVDADVDIVEVPGGTLGRRGKVKAHNFDYSRGLRPLDDDEPILC